MLDMAPDAPWRCPENCPVYERRLADAGWTQAKLTEPALEAEPADVPAADAADLLEDAEDIVSAVAPEALAEAREARAQRGAALGWLRAAALAQTPAPSPACPLTGMR